MKTTIDESLQEAGATLPVSELGIRTVRGGFACRRYRDASGVKWDVVSIPLTDKQSSIVYYRIDKIL